MTFIWEKAAQQGYMIPPHRGDPASRLSLEAGETERVGGRQEGVLSPPLPAQDQPLDLLVQIKGDTAEGGFLHAGHREAFRLAAFNDEQELFKSVASSANKNASPIRSPHQPPSSGRFLLWSLFLGSPRFKWAKRRPQ